MPALVICGKRTFLAGDDLRLYTYFALALRIVQLVVLIPLTIIAARSEAELRDLDASSCPQFKNVRLVDSVNILLTAYLVAAWVLAFISIGIEVGIWLTSGRGTPTQPELRWRLTPLCRVKMIPMSIYRWGLLATGIMCMLVLRNYCPCGGNDPTILCPQYDEFQTWLFILVITHTVEGITVALFAFYFGCKSRPRVLPQIMSEETKWKACCSCCCTVTTLLTCCLAGGTNHHPGDFGDIAITLADYFDSGGIIDVVATDVIVGLRMLARVQKKRQLECRKDILKRASVRFSKMRASTFDQLGVVDEEEMMVEKPAEQVNPMEMIAEDEEDDDNSKDRKDGNDDDDFDLDLDLAELVLLDTSSEVGDAPLALGASTKFALQSLGRPADRRKRMQQQQTPASRSVVYQMRRRRGGNVYFKPAERKVLSRKNRVDRLAVAEGARFMRYAWGIYIFRRFIDKGHKILRRCRKMHTEVTGDQVHESRLLAAAGLDHAEIVYTQLKEGLDVTPYAIAIDYAWKSVVVTIRGTFSLDDVVADLTLRPESLEEWGERCGFDGYGCHVHSGMLKCAGWIYEDLESHGVLDKLILDEDSHVHGYQLVLTGHSLGAGTASILSFMLKNKFPSLRCLAFSVPGCTMSMNMAQSCRDYLTSYVLDTDIVPRLSLESMEHLRDDIYEMVARIKVPKYKATHAKKGTEETDKLLYEKENIPESKFMEQFNEHRAHQDSKQVTRTDVPLYPPGNIVQLVKTSTEDDVATSGGCCCCGKVALHKSLPCAARWAQRDDLAEIVISPHFLDDHSSPNVLNELERVAKLFGMSQPYTLDDDDVESQFLSSGALKKDE